MPSPRRSRWAQGVDAHAAGSGPRRHRAHACGPEQEPWETPCRLPRRRAACIRPRHALLDEDGLASIAEAVEALANGVLRFLLPSKRRRRPCRPPGRRPSPRWERPLLNRRSRDRHESKVAYAAVGMSFFSMNALLCALLPLEQRAYGVGAEHRHTCVAQLIGNTRPRAEPQGPRPQGRRRARARTEHGRAVSSYRRR